MSDKQVLKYISVLILICIHLFSEYIGCVYLKEISYNLNRNLLEFCKINHIFEKKIVY